MLNFANQPFVNNTLSSLGTFSAGAGDFLSFGLTKKINDADGGSAFIDYGSNTYTAGKVTGVGVGIADLSAGAIKGMTSAAIEEGAPAIARGEVPTGGNFGRGGVVNQGPVRFGYGWKGTKLQGNFVIRLAIGAARGTSWYSHFDFHIFP